LYAIPGFLFQPSVRPQVIVIITYLDELGAYFNRLGVDEQPPVGTAWNRECAAAKPGLKN
jgi:hypothetical protein